MSRLLPIPATASHKLTTSFKPCKLDAVASWNAEAYVPPPHSLGRQSVKTAASTASWGLVNSKRNIPRDEPCFVMKDDCYVLQRAHWVNPVRDNPIGKTQVESFLIKMGIVGRVFNLDDRTNLTNLDPTLHTAMDKFDMFAITCSESSLDELTALVIAENAQWQAKYDANATYTRAFDFSSSPFMNAMYDIVVLHPQHFLPKKTCMASKVTGSSQLYGVDSDGVLRQHPISPASPRYPSFPFDHKRREKYQSLNPFLVVLAAEIKFRRLRRWRSQSKQPALDPYYETLISKTIQLAEHLYFEPTATEGTAMHDLELYHKALIDSDPEVSPLQVSDFGVILGGQSGNDSTARPAGRHGVTRLADAENVLGHADYGRNLLFGYRAELSPDDEDLLHEIQRDEWAAASPVAEDRVQHQRTDVDF